MAKADMQEAIDALADELDAAVNTAVRTVLRHRVSEKTMRAVATAARDTAVDTFHEYEG